MRGYVVFKKCFNKIKFFSFLYFNTSNIAKVKSFSLFTLGERLW
ncbi:hypothetical protein P618_201039 [Holospora obtusa F1]|uniref:Uncharacterized protein n=1 Tax=Holospora obtusa F1 TaxID=1399147 RepID=W6TD12_HOLOB|nr:hypothetical protein P618_201039 [Holospora obtusa F1]